MRPPSMELPRAGALRDKLILTLALSLFCYLMGGWVEGVGNFGPGPGGGGGLGGVGGGGSVGGVGGDAARR